jgi:hypothetical protein
MSNAVARTVTDAASRRLFVVIRRIVFLLSAGRLRR